jgi:hypothetical protein
MKKVMTAILLAVLVLSTIMAMGIDRVAGLFEFMAVSYAAALLVFLAYAWMARQRLAAAIHTGVSAQAAVKLVLTPTILAVFASMIMPLIALIITYPGSLLTDMYGAFQSAFLVDASTIALVLSLFTSLRVVVLARVPAYVLALAIAAFVVPLLYTLTIGWCALRQKKTCEECEF